MQDHWPEAVDAAVNKEYKTPYQIWKPNEKYLVAQLIPDT